MSEPATEVEVDITEDDEEVAEMETLLEEVNGCSPQPPAPSGAVDDVLFVTSVLFVYRHWLA